MPHHRPSNRPRSLHRQLSGRTSLSTTITSTHVPVPSVLERSLDEWLSRSNSNSSSNSVSSDKSGDPGCYGTGNGNHFTQSPIATTTRALTEFSSSPSPPSLPLLLPQSQPQPRPSASVPVNRHTDNHTHSSPQSSCPCCQLSHCQTWKKMSKVIRKLETETQLAAEIGQSLLQKNETYLVESHHLKKKLKQCEDRKLELEISLDDTERLAQKLRHEKDKWMWQYEKSEKILNESVADLENTNLNSAALKNDLEQTKLELEKLELFKYKSHQSDTREDTLQSKLKDTNQELMVSRKAELALESKYKKLLARYESLSCTYQDLCKNSSIKTCNSKQAEPLLSTNSDLKSKLLNASIQLDDTRNRMNILQIKHHNGNNITQRNEERLEKQTDKSNGDKRRTTITTIEDGKSGDDQPIMHTNGPRRHRLRSTRTPRFKCSRENIKSAPSRSSTNKRSPPIPQSAASAHVVHHHYHYYLRQRQQDNSSGGLCLEENNNDIISTYCDDRQCLDFSSSKQSPLLPASLPSDPLSLYNDTNTANSHYCGTNLREPMSSPLNGTGQIQHPQHHRNTTDEYLDSVFEKAATSASNKDAIDKHSLTLSPNSSAPIPNQAKTTIVECNSTPEDQSMYMSTPSKHNVNNFPIAIKSTPYRSLLDQAETVLQRLRSTDARILNRRLQRAFDIGELSNMSNAIIQNIVSDVDTMDARFFWLAPVENVADGGHCNGYANENDYPKNEPSSTVSSSSFLVGEFFAIVRLLQELLQEIGQLSITINHLQVAYVKKVEENEARVEKEIMGKHQLHSSANNRNDMVNIYRDINIPPSLVPSTSMSTPLSCTSSADSPNEHINISPIHWISSLFTHDTVTTRNLEKKTTSRRRPTSISSPNDSNNDIAATTPTSATLTRSGGQDGKPKDYPHRRLEEYQIKAAILRQPNKHLDHRVRQQQRQQRRSYRLDQNQNYNQLWPIITSIMDEWNQTSTIKHSFSSSLDREWLLDLH